MPVTLRTLVGFDSNVPWPDTGLAFAPTPQTVAPGQVVTTGSSITAADTAGQTTSDSITTVVATATAQTTTWQTDSPGDFADPTRWTGDIVPGATTDATIDFADRPEVLHDTGSHAVHSLTNTAGDFVMAGGTLAATDLTNASSMAWTGGNLVLNADTATAGALLNTGTLTIAANGQSLTGSGTLTNSGSITVTGGFGTATIATALVNTGTLLVNQGTLALTAGGSSAGSGLQTSASGVLAFAGGSFTIAGGQYAVLNTTITGGTLDVSAASSVFFVHSLRLSATGTLALGAQNATAQGGLIQSAGSGGTPILSGTGTLTVYNGGALTAGVETGSGLTQLIGTNQLGGSIQLDGGRTVENDGWMNWSSGAITLGAGDAAAASQTGTLTNVLGATFYVTADDRMGNQGAGSSVFDNLGVTAVYAGAGETDIDAAVANSGYIQAQTGTLSLNGGGSSDGTHLFVAAGAVLQFGTLAGGAAGGAFRVTGGQYTAGYTAITGGTLDVSAASGAIFANQLKLGAGELQLGGQSNAAVQGALLQTGGMLQGSQLLTVYKGATLTGGVQSGDATTRLYGSSVLGGGFQLDGGRTLENDGWLNWSSGDIVLGAGDAGAVTHSGTLSNVASSIFYVTADARIEAPGSGAVNNAGVIAVFAGDGETDIDAALNSPGELQVQSGTLSLNGGGTISAGNLFVAANAVLQFGTTATGGGGTANFTGGPYIAANTVVNGSTLDLSAVSGVSFGNSLTLASGSLLLGSNFPSVAGFEQSGGVLSGSGFFYASQPAELNGGLETGSGRTVLQAGGVLSGSVQLDGGRSLENDGTLVWSGGTITLGGGDAGAAVHAATLINTANAVLEIQAAGTLLTPGAGVISNLGTIVQAAPGTTTLAAGMFNNGTVVVAGGSLGLQGGVSGSGVFLLDGVAQLEFAKQVAGGETMQFLHPGGTLAVDTTGTFGATIAGFAAGDTIDVRAIGFVAGTTTEGFSGGTLSVTDGVQSAAFVLTGSYAAGGFQIAGDGHGGTAIGYV